MPDLDPSRRCSPWLVTLFLLSCRKEVAAPAAAAPPPVAVRLTAAATTPLPDVITAFGSLAPDEELVLAFEHAGRIAALPVDVGDKVRQGDVVARLDTQSFELEEQSAQAAVRQARVRLGLPPEGSDDAIDPEATPQVRQALATLTEAKLSLDRAQELVDRNLSAPAVLDTARAAHDVAESRLAQARNDVRDQQAMLAQRRIEVALAQWKVQESTLVAPFTGAIGARNAAAGATVRAADPVLTLLRTQPLRLRLRVPEREAARVALGQEVSFTADGAEGVHRGRVVRTSPRIDLETRTLLIEIEVENREDVLRPGMFARATIELGGAQERVTVPPSAIVAFAGVEKVLLAKDGVAAEQVITTGRRGPEFVEVIDGLEAGVEVILDAKDVTPGQPIRVEQASR
jgi:RND family efflux transporter MFP subunit